MLTDEKTRAGKSSSEIRIPTLEPALTPLVPEGMRVVGAKKWLDSGRPDNTANEYAGWLK